MEDTDLFGVPLPVLAMAVGDPDSGLNDMGRRMAAMAVLDALQNDEEMAVGWELFRAQMGIEDEMTVQDITLDQTMRMCEEFYRLVDVGLIPDPREVEAVRVMPSIDLDESEQELFNSIAETTIDRLKAQHFLHVDADGDMEAEADLYVLLTGILTNCSDLLQRNGYHEDADVLDAAAAVALKLFASHVRDQRKP